MLSAEMLAWWGTACIATRSPLTSSTDIRAQPTTPRREMKNLSNHGTALLVAALFVVLAGATFAQAPANNSLLISPGDQLHITILDMPDLEQEPRVTDAGDVPVQGIGNVKVS